MAEGGLKELESAGDGGGDELTRAVDRSDFKFKLSFLPLQCSQPHRLLVDVGQAANTHRMRKYHCTAGLQFCLVGWIQQFQYIQIATYCLVWTNPVQLNWIQAILRFLSPAVIVLWGKCH